MNKRGVSPVVATVLLLVLTVGLAAVIFSFVIPFVNDQLGNSKACLKVLDGVEFADSKFNCYNSSLTSGTGFETGFSFKVKKPEVLGVRVSFIDDNGNSEVKDFPYTVDDSRFKAVGASYGPALDNFPASGGQRTYIINNKYSKAEIAPMTETGDVCAVSDVVEFSPCNSDVAF
ncbi:MAG: archaellin/type IV pilin N-terminal domain-containing protein [Candidatus Pacearchaeota archaeon]